MINEPSDPIHLAMCIVYSFFSKVLRVYSSFENNLKIFVRTVIYAPKLFIVRVRTVLLWRASGDCIINFQTYLQLRWYRLYRVNQWFSTFYIKIYNRVVITKTIFENVIHVIIRFEQYVI